jgi:hypothetical protein
LKKSIMPQLQIFSEVHSKGGILLFKNKEEGHSWVWNAYNLFTGFMLDTPMVLRPTIARHMPLDRLVIRQNVPSNTTRTGTVNRNDDYANHGLQNQHGTSGQQAWYGIILGTSDSKFNIDDSYLHAPISHGNTSGQLFHHPMSQVSPVWDITSKRFYIDYVRFYNNNSGQTLTIKEVAMVSARTVGTVTDCYTALTRDVLETPIVVPDGGRITITYRLWSFPYDDIYAQLPTDPELGTAGNGGYCMGYRLGAFGGTAAAIGGGYAHPTWLWLLIASPIGGDSSGRFLNPSQSGTGNYNYGYDDSEFLVTNAATSGIGQALVDYRVATGESDWFIPSINEMMDLFNRGNHLPAGHKLAAADYYSATRIATNALAVNTAGADVSTVQTNSRRVRFVKRIHRDDWVPD